MKKIILFTLMLVSSFRNFSQNEDPAKLLSFSDKKQIETYLKGFEWKKEKSTFKDSVDGEYFLFSKKTSGGGYAYLAVYPILPNKFMHYMVFFEAKKKYSKVLSYDEFIHMPEGKSRYNYSRENKNYAIKSITFDDPKETRNQNIYFGLTSIKEGMDLGKISNEEIKDIKSLRKAKMKDMMDEMILDEKLNEDDSIPGEKDEEK